MKNSAESVGSPFCKRATGVPMALGAPSERALDTGGIEAILLVGVATISHLVISVSVINAGYE